LALVVAGAGEPQEGGIGARLACDDLHAEHPGVEAQRPFEIGDEQNGVVEADWGKCHVCLDS